MYHNLCNRDRVFAWRIVAMWQEERVKTGGAYRTYGYLRGHWLGLEQVYPANYWKRVGQAFHDSAFNFDAPSHWLIL